MDLVDMTKELATVSDFCSYIMRQKNGRLDENVQAFRTTTSSTDIIVGMSTGEYLYLILIKVSPGVCSVLLKTDR